jgi:hypothetical protein
VPRLDPQKISALAVAWVGFLGIVTLVTLAQTLPFRLTFVRPETFLTWFVRVELFFAVFLWPFFLPGLVHEGCGILGSLAALGMLAVLAAPLAAAAANLSAAPAGEALSGQILVAAAAAPAAALHELSRRRGWRRAGAWYLLAALFLSAVPPFAHFLLRELAGRGDLSALAWTSPFWAAAAAPWAAAGAFGGLALAGFAAGVVRIPRPPEEVEA